MSGDEFAGAIVPVSSVAKRAGVSLSAMKKRLKKLDRRHGGGLLVRFGDERTGRIYVDLAKLRELLPAYASTPVPPAPGSCESVFDEIQGVKASIADIHNSVAALRDCLG